MTDIEFLKKQEDLYQNYLLNEYEKNLKSQALINDAYRNHLVEHIIDSINTSFNTVPFNKKLSISDGYVSPTTTGVTPFDIDWSL